MEPRLDQVLTYVIEDYINSAEPVSSQSLVENHNLGVSSATVRNWYARLEQEEYLLQPHTSAGRIPTEKAFHWYVGKLDTPFCPKAEYQELIRIQRRTEGHHDYVKEMAKASVELTNAAALVGMNEFDTYYTGLTKLFSQPEFQDWSRVVSMSAILDRLDVQLNQLRKRMFEKPEILLGTHCPFGNACGSVIISLPQQMLFILLGPMRMNYGKARNVITCVHNLITKL